MDHTKGRVQNYVSRVVSSAKDGYLRDLFEASIILVGIAVCGGLLFLVCWMLEFMSNIL